MENPEKIVIEALQETMKYYQPCSTKDFLNFATCDQEDEDVEITNLRYGYVMTIMNKYSFEIEYYCKKMNLYKED